MSSYTSHVRSASDAEKKAIEQQNQAASYVRGKATPAAPAPSAPAPAMPTPAAPRPTMPTQTTPVQTVPSPTGTLPQQPNSAPHQTAPLYQQQTPRMSKPAGSLDPVRLVMVAIAVAVVIYVLFSTQMLGFNYESGASSYSYDELTTMPLTHDDEYYGPTNIGDVHAYVDDYDDDYYDDLYSEDGEYQGPRNIYEAEEYDRLHGR